jgi:hypothetical protein
MTKARTLADITIPSGTPVGTTDTQTLTNKTLTAPTIASANLTTALTIAGAAGSSGNVLTSAGSGNAPTWTTPSAGALTLISSATASSTALISFTGLTTSYRAYILEFDSVYMSVAGEGLLLQFSIDGGSNYITSGYARTLIAQTSATVTGNYSTTGTVLYVGGINGYSGASTQTGSGMLTIFAPATSGKNASTYVQASVLSSGVLENSAGAQTNTTTSAVNAFKLFAGSGNIAGGNFRLYGLANA